MFIKKLLLIFGSNIKQYKDEKQSEETQYKAIFVDQNNRKTILIDEKISDSDLLNEAEKNFVKKSLAAQQKFINKNVKAQEQFIKKQEETNLIQKSNSKALKAHQQFVKETALSNINQIEHSEKNNRKHPETELLNRSVTRQIRNPKTDYRAL